MPGSGVPEITVRFSSFFYKALVLVFVDELSISYFCLLYLSIINGQVLAVENIKILEETFFSTKTICTWTIVYYRYAH